jgi:hypothetical protein
MYLSTDRQWSILPFGRTVGLIRTEGGWSGNGNQMTRTVSHKGIWLAEGGCDESPSSRIPNFLHVCRAAGSPRAVVGGSQAMASKTCSADPGRGFSKGRSRPCGKGLLGTPPGWGRVGGDVVGCKEQRCQGQRLDQARPSGPEGPGRAHGKRLEAPTTAYHRPDRTRQLSRWLSQSAVASASCRAVMLSAGISSPSATAHRRLQTKKGLEVVARGVAKMTSSGTTHVV